AGSIGSMATPLAELDADILNFNGGTINDNATVQIGTTGDLDAGFLDAGIDNVNGSIGGDATINMSVGGTATVTNDLTAEIFGNDPTGSAAINFNGGTYNVSGNFRSTIDGNGTITLNNVTASADTFKVGAFGTDAMLKIGGGSLSGTNEFKLYANGTNGSIEFSASVTLSSAAAQMILAANSVTIDDGVVVTISGPMSAKVYASVLNYSGASGGNGTTTGIFANGSGATISPATDSRGNAPAFDGPPSAPSSKKSSAVASTNVQASSRKTIASAASLRGAADRG